MFLFMLSLLFACFTSNEIKCNAKEKIMELSSAFIVSRAIHVAAELGIADHMVDGPCAINTLAEKVDAHTDSLYRLMRLLASYGIFNENNKHFSLTDLALPLLSDHPQSLRAWLMYHDGMKER